MLVWLASSGFLDFRSSEIVSDAFVSVIATYCAGGEWRSGLYIAVSGV